MSLDFSQPPAIDGGPRAKTMPFVDEIGLAIGKVAWHMARRPAAAGRA